MTRKHHERIVNLIAALEDYEYNATFRRVDVEMDEFNAIRTLERRLKKRISEDPVEED